MGEGQIKCIRQRAACNSGRAGSAHLKKLHKKRVLRKNAREDGPFIVRIGSLRRLDGKGESVLARFQGLRGIRACRAAGLLSAHDGLRREEHLLNKLVTGWERIHSHSIRSRGGFRAQRLGARVVVNFHGHWPRAMRPEDAEASARVLRWHGGVGGGCGFSPLKLGVKQLQHRSDEAGE